MKKILLSITALLVSVSIFAQSSASLKMNLEKNKVYRFNSTSEQTITQTINGIQQTTDAKTDHTISLKMIDATADIMILEVHLDSMKTVTNTMGKTIVMSSGVEGDVKSAQSADIMSCMMNRLSKIPVYVKMDYTGKPLEIVNSKMLSSIILKDTSSITLTGLTRSVVKKQVEGLISDNALKTMIEPFTWHLPGKDIATGENWILSAKTNSGGMELDITTTYHLDGIKDNNASVTAESNIKASDNAAPIQSGGATVTYGDLAGLNKASVVIDIRTGLLVEDKGKTHIAGTLGISGPGFSMQMPMDINGESKTISLQ